MDPGRTDTVIKRVTREHPSNKALHRPGTLPPDKGGEEGELPRHTHRSQRQFHTPPLSLHTTYEYAVMTTASTTRRRQWSATAGVSAATRHRLTIAEVDAAVSQGHNGGVHFSSPSPLPCARYFFPVTLPSVSIGTGCCDADITAAGAVVGLWLRRDGVLRVEHRQQVRA